MDTPTVITLDLSECQYIDDLHQRIKTAFDFPDYYGENWDAFWDLIRGARDNTMVEIKGVASLSKALRKEVDKMIECLEDNIQEMEKLKQRRPDFDCRFGYQVID
ncbi:MAG: barstar family protein [Clostridiales bacterium]|nr:barstar family protein [Clostridiales bacterium]